MPSPLWKLLVICRPLYCHFCTVRTQYTYYGIKSTDYILPTISIKHCRIISFRALWGVLKEGLSEKQYLPLNVPFQLLMTLFEKKHEGQINHICGTPTPSSLSESNLAERKISRSFSISDNVLKPIFGVCYAFVV